jgi:hypothetical protein
MGHWKLFNVMLTALHTLWRVNVALAAIPIPNGPHQVTYEAVAPLIQLHNKAGIWKSTLHYCGVAGDFGSIPAN